MSTNAVLLSFGTLILCAGISPAQQPGPGGGFPPGGSGGPGGMMNAEERKLAARFDADKNGRLDITERAAARAFIKENPAPRGGFGPRGGQGRMGGGAAPEIKPGKAISPADVTDSRGPLYDESTLRTLFIDFETKDWEAEMEDFHNTDIDVPATLGVDGKTLPGAGIHFRGKSSYMMARRGQKRSLNVSLDHSDPDQRFEGYKTLNLNNSFGDPGFLGAAIYSHIARTYIPAPKVNFVRVVIDGEDWGIYQNQQQFDKIFLKENFNTTQGARWKAPGSPMGNSGLEDLGDDPEPYKKRFEMKSGGDEDWQALVKLCQTLNQTPADQLEAALAPMLDLESTLWFLALDCTLMNSDGYWTRASDFNLYRSPEGVFHIIPHDINESFRAEGGFGRRGQREEPAPGAATHAFDLDPLAGKDDASKPLRSKLLAVPSLRQRYLDHVATIARDWLDWEKLGPLVASYRNLIQDVVATDTRKNGSTEAFLNLTADQPVPVAAPAGSGQGRGGFEGPGGPRGPGGAGARGGLGGPGGRGGFGGPGGPGGGGAPFRTFADDRRAFLLEHPAIAGE